MGESAHRLRRMRAAVVGAVVLGALMLVPSAGAAGVPFHTGDVLAGVGNGMIKHFDSNGVLLDTLDTTHAGSEDTGMCFDGAGKLYATVFEANIMSKFDSSGNLLVPSFGSGFNAHPESCVVDANNHVLVGQADGSTNVLEFDLNGNLLATFAPQTGQNRGTDWIDLAKDQCTLSYAGEGSDIKRFNVCTNSQLPDFADGLPAPCFAHRILSDGGELIACESEVLRLSATGTVVQTYNPDPGGFLFALNIDPDGTSFWTADIFSGQIYHVDIATGAVIKTFNAGIFQSLAGLTVVGEQTVSKPPDTTPPSCNLTKVVVGPPKQIQITVQDSGSGLASIVVTNTTNANTPVPPFTPGTTAAVTVTSTKINQTMSSQVALKVTDVAGNTTSCDPAFLSLNRTAGKQQSVTVKHLTRAESKIQTINGSPGVGRINITVDGKVLAPVRLSNGQTKITNVASAMRSASNNTITLTPAGKRRGSATVLIHD